MPRQPTHIAAGTRHQWLTFIRQSSERHGLHAMGVWRCDCGNICLRINSRVINGKSMSCGCAQGALRSNMTHGYTGTPEIRAWHGLWGRCANPNDKSYENYGGRGITVCPRWEKFENFLADMGNRPSDRHSIDRIDNEGNYEPGNCRWATLVEQARNKRTTIKVSFGLQILTVPEIAEKTGRTQSSVRHIVKAGRIASLRKEMGNE